MRINERTRIPIEMAIVLLLGMGIAMPVTAEEVQAEDVVFLIGGYDLGLIPFDTEAGDSEGIDPEIAVMPYRLVNPDYVPEEFVILRTGGEFSAEDVEADCELLEKKWEGLRGKNVRNRPIGYGMPVLDDTDTLSAYGVAIRPDGVCEQYFGYGSYEDLTSGKSKTRTTDATVTDMPSIETRAEEWKQNVTKELSAFTLAESQPYLIGSQTLSITVSKDIGYYDNYGHISLTTWFYWDHREQDPQYDYFFAKSTLFTEPGASLWNNEMVLNRFKLIHNWKYFQGVQKGLTPLPGVNLVDSDPQTTTGYRTVQLSISPSTATLGWSTTIPDKKVQYIGSSASARAGWEEIFSSGSDCAQSEFKFTGASAVLCNQKSWRDGKSYGLCSATTSFMNGWAVPDWIYGPRYGTTSISHIYVVKWS